MNSHEPCEAEKQMPLPENGSSIATSELFELLHGQLQRVASRLMAREGPGQTIQATALINEVFLRLAGVNAWDNQRHFFVAASETMRRVLIDIARRKKAIKNGGRLERVPCCLEFQVTFPVVDEILDLESALCRFEVLFPKKAKLVKLKFFGGLTMKEAAAVLGIGLSTAERYWTYSKAWLHQELKSAAPAN